MEEDSWDLYCRIDQKGPMKKALSGGFLKKKASLKEQLPRDRTPELRPKLHVVFREAETTRREWAKAPRKLSGQCKTWAVRFLGCDELLVG